jgi:hypothetical protein
LTHAIVTASLAPLLGSPDLRAELVSQAPLGHLLAIVEERDRFLRVRGEDDYPGWIHRGYVAHGDAGWVESWRADAHHISLGAVLSLDGRTRVQLPLGARVAPEAGGAVHLPDGRIGQLAGGRIALVSALQDEAREMPPATWAEVFFSGAPYLWGGVTPWGVDCSGLVQVTFRMRGIALPRDAHLQAKAGSAVTAADANHDFESGDLLFFTDPAAPGARPSGGGDAGRVTHVAIADGAGGVMHASLAAGGVCRSPLSGESAEAAELRRSFVAARRV